MHNGVAFQKAIVNKVKSKQVQYKKWLLMAKINNSGEFGAEYHRKFRWIIVLIFL